MEYLREQIPLGPGRAFRILRWNRSLRRVEVLDDHDRSAPLVGHGDRWHYHRASELTLIQHGVGTRFVADHIELFEPGDIVLLGSNVPHYWHVRGDSKGMAVQWYFPREHGIWSFGEASRLEPLEESARRGLHIRGTTAQVTRKRMEQLVHVVGLARLSVLIDILGLLADAPACDVRSLSVRPFSLSGTAEHQEAVRRAVSYILARHREPLRLDDLLQLVSMSRATFARQFHRHAGKSFSVFLNQVRLQAVCRKLKETADPIGSIAFEHGFNNLSFFNRLFRREIGVNPMAYRNRTGEE